MSKIYFTSDLHFGHDKDFLWSPRGFTSSREHDETIIRKWNLLINPEDTVYILGDCMLKDDEYGMRCLKRLNGQLKFIRGNHDSNNRWSAYATLPNAELLGHANVLKYNKYNFYISHYPTITSNYDFYKPLTRRVINLCGHCHTKDKFLDFDKGIIYHVELDAHNCLPVLLDDIIEDIKEKLKEESE